MTDSGRSTAKSQSAGWNWPRVLIGVFIVAHGLIAADVARRYAVTHDEYWHIPVGLLNATTGRFDYDHLNPPLLRTCMALPLLLTGAQSGDIPPDAAPHEIGDAFLRANPKSFDTLSALARLPIVPGERTFFLCAL